MYTSYTHEKGLRQAAPIQNALQNQQSNCSIKSSKPTKTKRVLVALMERSYNRFEAARSLSDWCLHSTVSTIQSKGIIVLRKFETVPGFDNNPTSVKRYWIAEDQFDKAAKYLQLS